MKTMNVEWHDYQAGDNPTRDDNYLVLLNKDQGLSLGFGANPPVLTAHFNYKTQEWASLGSMLPILDLKKMIIAWHEIPPFQSEQK